MNVKEFYNAGYNVFSKTMLDNYTTSKPFIENSELEAHLLNFIFLDHFETTEIFSGNETIVQSATNFTLNQWQIYFNAIRSSLELEFDPTKESGSTTTSSSEEIISGTISKGANNHNTNTNSGVDTTTDTTKTSSSTDINTLNKDAAYQSTGLKDTSSSDTSGSPSNNYTQNSGGVSISHGLTTETSILVDEDQTNNSSTHNSGTTTSNSFNDYAKNLKDMYESKTINLYEEIVNKVFDIICVPVYEF